MGHYLYMIQICRSYHPGILHSMNKHGQLSQQGLKFMLVPTRKGSMEKQFNRQVKNLTVLKDGPWRFIRCKPRCEEAETGGASELELSLGYTATACLKKQTKALTIILRTTQTFFILVPLFYFKKLLIEHVCIRHVIYSIHSLSLLSICIEYTCSF